MELITSIIILSIIHARGSTTFYAEPIPFSNNQSYILHINVTYGIIAQRKANINWVDYSMRVDRPQKSTPKIYFEHTSCYDSSLIFEKSVP